MLTLAASLGSSTLQAQAQQYASLAKSTTLPKSPDSPNAEPFETANASFPEVIGIRWDKTPGEAEVKLEKMDEKSLSFIVKKVGTERSASALASARVFAEDSLLYMNRAPSTLKRPEDLSADRGVSLFKRTGLQSIGDYLDQNYQPRGIISFIRETFLDDPFDKRIVSPLSPADAGTPGEARARKNDIHLGLRDLGSFNPKSFVTFGDKSEMDVAANGPSFILRNPIGFEKKRSLTTLFAVEYPDWRVNSWSIPRIGATLAYVHGNQSINLMTSAGKGNFESGNDRIESRFEQRIMFYLQCAF